MDAQLLQNIRYKLQKRVRRLNSVEYPIFATTLKQFWHFFDSNPILSGIAARLSLQFPDLSTTVDRIFANESLLGENEAESAAIGQEVLRRLAANYNDSSLFHLARGYRAAGSSKINDALETVRDVFLEPFYEYVDESLDDQRAMLGLLLKYKHRSEWFHRAHLNKLVQIDPRKAEKSLALDLYAYLYDQGLNFHIESSSLTGEVDLIAAQGTEDPLILDAKIFDGEGRSKNYIKKGFNQIYTYTQQYNEPFGYLVIYKTTSKDLRFSLRETTTNIPVISHNYKTVFLITIDVYLHDKPVSQRNPLNAIEITEGDLVSIEASNIIDDTSNNILPPE